jgi:hydroxymethylglutaryl-CoA lyase
VGSKLPASVRIVDVGPRDGLQNEKAIVPTDVKVALIEKLADAGVPAIEATSFVSPKWVPQMADAADVMARVRRRPDVTYAVLTPYMKGFEGALAARADEVVVFGAASEAFSRKNINCSIAESIERFAPVTRAARDAGMRVRGVISCCLGCPYQGAVAPEAVGHVTRLMRDIGVHHVGIADTIGVGTPAATQRALEAALAVFPVVEVSGHFHDTYGQALANVYASLELGIATFDTSVSGLGGCPYAKGATGNVPTEDVVYMLHGLSIATGIDLDRLRAAGRYISEHLQRPSGSRVARALDARDPVAA